MTKQKLFELAITAQKNSYAPYSNFNVGAALLTENNEVYLGCNIENASFSPTVCAERVAFFKAISDGVKSFKAIAIVGGNNYSVSDLLVTPCGVCRQVMAEFCKDDFKIILNNNNKLIEYSLGELYPLGFSTKNTQ